VFDRGQFTLYKAELLGTVLIIYSISLVGQALQRALLAPFYARLDTRTPLRNALYGVAANLVLLPLLVLPFGVHHPIAIVGVALAYSLAQYVNAGHAWYRLTKADGNPLHGVLPFALKLAVASAASALTMIGASLALNLGDPTFNRAQLLIRTPIAGLGGLLVLLAVMYLLAGREIVGWRRMLSRRPRPGLPRTPAGGTQPIEDPDGTRSAGKDPGPGATSSAGHEWGTDADLAVESAAIAANLP
jgi:putative peptidoglycan lipid II flippase